LKYSQLTEGERYTILMLRVQNFPASVIATILDRHRSTIYRELNRNSSNDGRYRVDKASSRTGGRRSRSRRNQQFGDWAFALLKRLLAEKWSPEQISLRLRKEKVLSISYDTIYRYIRKDKQSGGELYKYLRHGQKQLRKGYGHADSRGVLRDKRAISERPTGAENRSRLGHWEIDTVMGGGSKDCILTMVDRKSGITLIGKLRNRTTRELNKVVAKLIRSTDYPFKSITADNGTEFHGYSELEKKTGVKFYFATPYHSWERGSNENTNGLIRQYLPKRESMASLSQRDCNRIAEQLNNRPRKRFDFRTPIEVHFNKSVALQI